MEAARETALGEHGNDLDVLSLHTLVLDRMSEGVSVSDESGYILYTNAAEDRMFGYERGELIGKHVTVQNAYPEDVNRRIVADVIATLRSSGEWKGEWLNRKKDGSAFHTQARISALRQGGRSYWVCVQEDITERRVAETELREANQKLSALIGSSPLPIVAFGRDGLIDMWNPAAERVFGWTEAEVVGKPLPFIPSDRAAEHRTMREQDLSGQGFTNRELRRMRKDGTPIDISVSTAPMFDGSGQVSGVMSVYLDITERKRAADEQRLNVERLELLERQLTLLVEASGALLASPESAQVLRTILDVAQQFIHADAYAVWRKQSENWRLIASTGLSETYARTFVTESEGAPLPDVPFALEDVCGSPWLARRTEMYQAEGIVSMLAVPLRIQGEISGTIVFYHRTRHASTDTELRIAGAIGNLAASALGAAELYDRQAQLRAAAETAERRASFLAAVGAEVASSLDYETTLNSVARLAVPSFSDWCSVDVVEPDGSIRRLAIQHADAAKIEFAREWHLKYPPRPDDTNQVVIRTGEPMLFREIPEALLAERAYDAEHLALIRELGLKSAICVPMLIRGRTVGAITFVSSEPGRRYGGADLELAMDIAHRAAVAVDNARLFRDVRDSEERFRRLFDSNMVAVAFWNVEGVVTAANDAYLQIVGVTRGELERDGGIHWTALTPAEHRATDERIIRECYEHGASSVYEKEYLRQDGTRATVLIAAAFLSESRTEGVAFVLDISERKRLDRQFRGVADIALLISGASTVQAILNVLNERVRLVIGCRVSSVRLDATGAVPTDPDCLAVILKNRAGEQIGHIQVRDKAHEDFTANDRAILVQLAEMASIAIENAELNESLRHSNQELKRVNEDLNQFAYSASHDLQEPLRMIAIYTQLLARKFGLQTDDETRQYVRYTLDGAQRMEMLLRDLLAYTQAVNIHRLPEEPVPVETAIRKALDNLQGAMEQTGAAVHFEDLPPVRAYEVHLIQLFQNLIGNALKYRSEAAPEIQVTASLDTAEGRWLFAVKDNGIGIDSAYHQQVFGIFRRLHPAERFPGTGIGLAICQKVVERYGGRIWVESEEGRGSTFFFTLPA
jgi:PAS domain S-box-containing protein